MHRQMYANRWNSLFFGRLFFIYFINRTCFNSLFLSVYFKFQWLGMYILWTPF